MKSTILTIAANGEKLTDIEMAKNLPPNVPSSCESVL
jgi:hypothetical protein